MAGIRSSRPVAIATLAVVALIMPAARPLAMLDTQTSDHAAPVAVSAPELIESVGLALLPPIDPRLPTGRSRPAAPTNVYAAATGAIRPELRDIAPRVYVPNEKSNSVSVIDPATMTVVREIKVGSAPQHITPAPDFAHLYVNDDGLTELDVRSGAVTRKIAVAKPYNLYFTLDGRHAIVVAEDLNRLDEYTYPGWAFERSVAVPWRGVDHLDLSADGSFAIATTEYEGVVLKLDIASFTIVASAKIATLPVDVRLAPDGTRFYITDQGRGGVIVLDAARLVATSFVGTGRGAHGLAISRDARSLYVSNRLEGTITVIDTATDRVTGLWHTGGSPDMLQVSPDGTQLWTGDRFADTVTVVNTTTGLVTARVKVGRAPHGLAYFPQPGDVCIGHNGIFR